MEHLEIVLLVLLLAAAGLTALAQRVGIPYPIVLVVGGLVLGFVPGMPEADLDPDLVLVIFLPPLLYSAAFFSSLRDLRANLRPISLLAIGLVLVTMCAVAVVAHALIDGLPWAAAFALGAIVSPTDPIAATAVARRLGAPRRIVSIVEGESLVNDATALVAYRVAVGAAVGGSFSLVDAGVEFVLGAAGGVAIGLVVAWLVAQVRRRIEDPPVEITISILTGYAAYIPADELGLSGVLAAVTAGVYLGWHSPRLVSPTTRLHAVSVWETLTFLLNSTLFILIGLQLRPIVERVGGTSMAEIVAYAGLVSAVVIATRLLWMHTVPYLIRALDRRESQVARRADWRSRTIVGWSGMRGGVSLAAALALPLATDAGAPFPRRDEILFIAFGVILATLVLQGLTLPGLIRRLGVSDEGLEEREEIEGRIAAVEAALARLEELSEEDWTRDDTIERLRGLYDYRHRRFTAQAEGAGDTAAASDGEAIEERAQAYQQLVRHLLDAQRAELVRLRNEGRISDEVLRRIQRELDLEDTRLEI